MPLILLLGSLVTGCVSSRCTLSVLHLRVAVIGIAVSLLIRMILLLPSLLRLQFLNCICMDQRYHVVIRGIDLIIRR